MKIKLIYSIANNIFNDMTIKRKLITIIMLASTMSLILVGTVFIFWQWFNLRHSMVRSLSTQAKVIADNCKASITFNEPQDANDVMKALRAEPSIIFGGIYTLNGKLFAYYHRHELERYYKYINPGSFGHVFDRDLLTVYESVVVEEVVALPSLPALLACLAFCRSRLSLFR